MLKCNQLRYPFLFWWIDNQIIVEFEKTEFDNPFVQGLFLFKGTLEETDYSDREEYKANWEKKYANISREEKKASL